MVKRTIELITRTEVTIEIFNGTIDGAVNSIAMQPTIIGGSFAYNDGGRSCYSTSGSNVELIEWSVIK